MLQFMKKNILDFFLCHQNIQISGNDDPGPQESVGNRAGKLAGCVQGDAPVNVQLSQAADIVLIQFWFSLFRNRKRMLPQKADAKDIADKV